MTPQQRIERDLSEEMLATTNNIADQDSDILIIDDKVVEEDLANKAYESKDPSRFPD